MELKEMYADYFAFKSIEDKEDNNKVKCILKGPGLKMLAIIREYQDSSPCKYGFSLLSEGLDEHEIMLDFGPLYNTNTTEEAKIEVIRMILGEYRGCYSTKTILLAKRYEAAYEDLNKQEQPTNSAIKPNHYKSKSGQDVIDVLEDFDVTDFYLGSAVKYILRAGKKDPSKEVQDLQKAIEFINRKIQYLSK